MDNGIQGNDLVIKVINGRHYKVGSYVVVWDPIVDEILCSPISLAKAYNLEDQCDGAYYPSGGGQSSLEEAAEETALREVAEETNNTIRLEKATLKKFKTFTLDFPLPTYYKNNPTIRVDGKLMQVFVGICPKTRELSQQHQETDGTEWTFKWVPSENFFCSSHNLSASQWGNFCVKERLSPFTWTETSPELLKCLSIAEQIHAGQFDKSGVPYLTHPVRLSKKVTTLRAKCIALLHDCAEDNPSQYAKLIAEHKISGSITSGVALLSRCGKDSYDQCIDDIVQSSDVDVLEVKKIDLYDNLDPSRTANIPIEQILKYKRALARINWLN